MHNFIQGIRFESQCVREALRCEPEIQLDLEHAGLAITLAIMLSLLGRGMDDPNEISSYLATRGSKFDLETIKTLLDAYDGINAQYHLWTRLCDDTYVPLIA
ncbi:hypothetical protein [Sphingomonas sp. Leaf20]|uniref:hypothetical protein n=1 Tax=Sphingomonas sp. Leaf20 TaxID=1735685 RepID=UPI0006F4B191|nr:hypothetical protein [Sphingomonas sp. Leaf20]KQM71694.1 hypothetical protein ASE72_09230 [Sphingomonas sp. Leaf20]